MDEEGEVIKNSILAKITAKKFLLRQNSGQNGAFPMQLHLDELKRILKNQSKYYPFLLDKDSNGISNSDKIISIFKYKLPYYVGPLNRNSKNSWVIRSDEKIYPWNYEKVIDLNETAKEFITRMQNKCTYLKGDTDYCLPKNSLLYSEFLSLAYLNKVYINGSHISKNLKDELFNNVFLVKKKPTKKDIINYIESHYGKDVVVGKEKGLPELNVNMSSYIKFKEIFSENFEENYELIENIIRDITIFEDKSILENRLLNHYNLDIQIVKKIKDLNYSGYGRLSKNLINGIECIDPTTGELKGTVIQIMRNTNMNLQEILNHPDYRLLDRVDDYNNQFFIEENDDLNEFIDENINISPIIKRPIVQTMKIIEEIEKIIGNKIDEFYIECTRTNKAKKRTPSSRYEKIKELYKNISQDIYNVDLKKLNEELENNKDNLRSDKIYLYFAQLGKCMYSLEKIDLYKLFQGNNDYDIDHIFPQSIIKDDSINNRILVRKNINNNEKRDKFLFECKVKNKMADNFYEILLDKKLISAEKYRRLTLKEISEGELEGFVNRQLVVTNQSVKGLIELLKLYKGIDSNNIIFSKGENISDFRHKFDLVKSRLANNFHHAHDAYLNAVVGSIINQYFKVNYFLNKSNNYVRIDNEKRTLNPIKIFEKDKWPKENSIWNKSTMIEKIKRDLYNRFDINETFRSYNPQTMFSKITILPASNANSIPVKQDARADVTKYGGITSSSYSRYVIIKTLDNKNREKIILEAIPKTSVPTFDNEAINRIAIEKYLAKIYSNFEILYLNVKSNVVVCDDKLKFVITSRYDADTYSIKNIQDKFFSYLSLVTIKKIEKYELNINKKIPMLIDDNYIIVAPAKNENCQEIRLTKTDLEQLFEEIMNQFSKDIYAFIQIAKNKEKLIMKINTIQELSIENFLKLIRKLLSLLRTNENKPVDLTIIGLPKNSCKLTINKKLKPGMKFVHESVTGYYKKVLFEV